MSNKTKPFQDKKHVDTLAKAIKALVSRPLKLMEVCGTHTMAIFRHGIRSLLPDGLELVSGPGCPVCVTSQDDLDRIMKLASVKEVVIATFGDLIRVPGSSGTLAQARAQGANVEIVYSPADALGLAKKMPQKQVVFLAVGFETTAPTVAATIMQAKAMDIENFSVYSCHKLMPPALDALFQDEDLGIDGLLCPGHVSSIIGSVAYEPLCKKYKMPCVIAGFEPVDILLGIYHLLLQIKDSSPQVVNAYQRAVPYNGNPNALSVMMQVFCEKDAIWRGLGKIEKSGLGIKDAFGHFDAGKRFPFSVLSRPEPKGCLCGDIIRARANPPDCPLFATKCTPVTPIGPCMVSSEGTCSAYYRYGRHENR